MDKKNPMPYQAPRVKVVSFQCEHGFAMSEPSRIILELDEENLETFNTVNWDESPTSAFSNETFGGTDWGSL